MAWTKTTGVMMSTNAQLSAMLADICEVLFGPDANDKPFGNEVPNLLSYNHCMWACAIRDVIANLPDVTWLDVWASKNSDAKETDLKEWRAFLVDLKTALAQ